MLKEREFEIEIETERQIDDIPWFGLGRKSSQAENQQGLLHLLSPDKHDQKIKNNKH